MAGDQQRAERRLAATLGADTTAIVDWLADGARSTRSTEGLLAELCDRLLGCGIPVWRVGLFVLALHPQIMGTRFLWKRGQDVDINRGPYEVFETEDFRRSPVRRVIDTGLTIRRRFADQNCPIDFTTLGDLRAEGATDHVALPMFFADGSVRSVTFATQQPGGFSDADIASLESIVAPLTRVVETQTLRYTATALLNTYVGGHAGARVFAGHIRRGHTTAIEAAIWLSDMRGFTRLADRVPAPALIDLLNRYFDCQVPAILEHGGEVLKFMGDGLLAIFPVGHDGKSVTQVCDAALAAACQARAAILSAAAESERLATSRAPFGLGLHVGQVSYGNIGSGSRLDFTCIGPAVNLAARIEKLAGKLGRTILASQAFASHLPSRFVPVGEFALPGFGISQAVFGLELEDEQRDERGEGQ